MIDSLDSKKTSVISFLKYLCLILGESLELFGQGNHFWIDSVRHKENRDWKESNSNNKPKTAKGRMKYRVKYFTAFKVKMLPH